jgi:hypothetical protein
MPADLDGLEITVSGTSIIPTDIETDTTFLVALINHGIRAIAGMVQIFPNNLIEQGKGLPVRGFRRIRVIKILDG